MRALGFRSVSTFKNMFYVIIFLIVIIVFNMILYFTKSKLDNRGENTNSSRCEYILTRRMLHFLHTFVYIRFLVIISCAGVIMIFSELYVFEGKGLAAFVSLFLLLPIILVMLATLVTSLESLRKYLIRGADKELEEPELKIVTGSSFQEFTVGLKKRSISQAYTFACLLRWVVFAFFLIILGNGKITAKFSILAVGQGLFILYGCISWPFRTLFLNILMLGNDAYFMLILIFLWVYAPESSNSGSSDEKWEEDTADNFTTLLEVNLILMSVAVIGKS